jgi:hypothetical protein
VPWSLGGLALQAQLSFPHWLLAVEIEPGRIGPSATIVILVPDVVFVLDTLISQCIYTLGYQTMQAQPFQPSFDIPSVYA